MRLNSTALSVRTASEIVGGLSRPSKMPCYGYSLPASACKIGQLLARQPGSVCEGCYAADTVDAIKRRTIVVHGGGRLRWNRYAQHNVRNALQRRLDSLDHPDWVRAMVFLIEHYRRSKRYRYFRWHDSGDLQSVDHLGRICAVCDQTPRVRHWLPSRETGIVRQYRTDNPLPGNLVVRLSAAMVGGAPPTSQQLPTSTVGRNIGKRCHAYSRDGHCGLCRACWNPAIENIDYPFH